MNIELIIIFLICADSSTMNELKKALDTGDRCRAERIVQEVFRIAEKRGLFKEKIPRI